MESKFSKEEKRKYSLKKHIKDHLFEYILDIIGPIIFTIILLHLCGGQDFVLGVFLSIAYSIGKIAYDLVHYKKDYIDINIK